MDTINAPRMIEHAKETLNFTPHDTKWLPISAKFLCCGVSASNKGYLRMHELDKEGLKTILDMPNATPHGIKCMTFGASLAQHRYHVAFGDYDGRLTVLDIEHCSNQDKRLIFSTKAHEGVINAIDGVGGMNIGNGAPELVTGGKDGCVRVWDTRVQRPVVELEPCSESKRSTPRDCWTVAFGNSFNNTERYLCAGYDNGDVKLYNLKTNTILWSTNCQNGITSVEFDRKDIEMNKLVVTTLESSFYCYELRTQHATKGFSFLKERAHRSTIWKARHVPQNRDLFMTCGGNGGLNLYKYHYPLKRQEKSKIDSAPVGVIGKVELLNSKVITDQPIVSFDWSADKEGLCCMSCLDQSLR